MLTIRRYKGYLIPCIFIIILMAITIYVSFIHPSIKLHTIADETFLKQFMKKQFDACNDPSLFNVLTKRSGSMSLDYWYMYYYLPCKNYTFYTLFNKVNRFTDEVNLCIYGVEHSTNQPFHYIIPMHQKDIRIESTTNQTIVQKDNVFRFSIDYQSNRFTYDVHHPGMEVHLDMKGTDWNTNFGSFFPRYQPLRYLFDIDSHVNKIVDGYEFKHENEWFVDSPCTGDLVSGTINGIPVGPGMMWFDTYSGTNYHFLEPYSWLLIHNDDWLIYLLQYDVAPKITPMLIKNKRDQRWFYSGAAQSKIIEPAGTIIRALEPLSYTISTENGWGSNVAATFVSNEIRISIRSKPNTILPIFQYKYYDSSNLNPESLSKDDAQYYDLLQSIRFDEYTCQAEVDIEYDGKQEHLDTRMLYEIMHRV